MALTRINNQALTNVTSAGLPSGTVLQVKSVSSTSPFTSTSTSWTTVANLSVSITPKSANSKILIMYAVSGNANTRYWSLTAFRDSTAINRGGASASRERISTPTGANEDETNQAYIQRSISDTFLDSPSTTSEITYSVKGRIHYNSGTMYVNRDQNDDNYSYAKRSSSNIIVMEIAG
jgi:S-formylglutathione hydrolase FrmB